MTNWNCSLKRRVFAIPTFILPCRLLTYSISIRRYEYTCFLAYTVRASAWKHFFALKRGDIFKWNIKRVTMGGRWSRRCYASLRVAAIISEQAAWSRWSTEVSTVRIQIHRETRDAKRFVGQKNHVPQRYFTIKRREKPRTTTWDLPFRLRDRAEAFAGKDEEKEKKWNERE